jgi:carbon storage regulator
MLVLSRRPGQKINIGNEITVEVISVSGEGVRLGISAPDTMAVHRNEVFVEIQNANHSAGTADLSADSLEGLSALLRSRSRK